MNTLKKAITEAPVLVSLDFSPSGFQIFLNVDTSTSIGWGAILSQLQSDGTVHPAGMRVEYGLMQSKSMMH